MLNVNVELEARNRNIKRLNTKVTDLTKDAEMAEQNTLNKIKKNILKCCPTMSVKGKAFI